LRACEAEGLYERDSAVPFFTDMVAALAQVFGEVADGISPSKQDKMENRRARYVFRSVAEQYRRVSGRLPPRNKGCWTLDFIEALCQMLGFEEREDRLSSIRRAIKEMDFEAPSG
jgi:hypothetical protein